MLFFQYLIINSLIILKWIKWKIIRWNPNICKEMVQWDDEMWGIAQGKVYKNMTFMSLNKLPNWTCCMSSCNRVWIFSRNFGIWTLALIDDVFLTMNVSRVWNTWVTVDIFFWLVLVLQPWIQIMLVLMLTKFLLLSIF